MGKNQAYKAMQRARLGSSSAGPDEVEDGMVCTLPYYPIQFQFYSFFFFFFIFISIYLNCARFFFSINCLLCNSICSSGG